MTQFYHNPRYHHSFKTTTSLLLVWLLAGGVFSKLNAQEGLYFQQKVDCQIKVRLDDQNHRLIGTLDLDYYNQSPDTLQQLYFHIWANAYESRETAFAKQQLRYGNTDFYWANPEERGGYTRLSIQDDEQDLNWSNWEGHSDVIKLELMDNLLPNQKIQLQMGFEIQIPVSFSRMGHIGESYQITQWFPKPAVYDRAGWHPMPYLDAGEFYSEYGDYEIEITLPDNYIVAATGTLETESERRFLNKKRRQTNQYILNYDPTSPEALAPDPFPTSSNSQKTIRYTAKNVHDFAWFADKRFKVQRSTVALGQGKEVATWVFFTKTQEQWWFDALKYLGRSLEFYNEAVGTYPYPQMTAVQSALSAGAGMEYPMITVIGEETNPMRLDEVITHEVGHNWFYGVLGFNERDHSYLDEGVNSYYEQRYMRQHYGKQGYELVPKILRGQSKMSSTELLYQLQKRRGEAQAPMTSSNDLTTINYWLNSYDLPAFTFHHLESSVGQEKLDKALQAFYEKWASKHPGPKDLQETLSQELGMNLDWLFQGFFGSTDVQDYALLGLEPTTDATKVRIKNKGEISAPFSLLGIDEEGRRTEQWYPGFTGTTEVELPASKVQKVVLDAKHQTLEARRDNNTIKSNSFLARLEPLQINLLPRLKNDLRSQLVVTPLVSWNNYDGLMTGAFLSNLSIPEPNFEIGLLPFYSTQAKTLVGSGFMNWKKQFYQGSIKELKLGIKGRSYHFQEDLDKEKLLRYRQIQPHVELHFRTDPRQQLAQFIRLDGNFINRDRAPSGPEGSFILTTASNMSRSTLSYHRQSFQVIKPYQLEAGIRRDRFASSSLDFQNFWQLYLAIDASLMYQDQKRIFGRLYVGGSLNSEGGNQPFGQPNAFDLTTQGWNDAFLNNTFLGRSEEEGIWSQQIVIDEGGFKLPTTAQFGPRSDQFLIALNLMADLPEPFPILPLRPFLDMGYLGGQETDNFFWSAGIGLELWHQRVGIYLPLWYSDGFKNAFQDQSWTRQISFTFNLQDWHPIQLLDGR